MTEFARPRRFPKKTILGLATTLALVGCHDSNTAPTPTPESPHRGDDTIIRQFRTVAEKAISIFNAPPAGAVMPADQEMLDLPFTTMAGPKSAWELHIASYPKTDTTNPIRDQLRQVTVLTGKNLPTFGGDADASISASINSTSNGIGTSVEVRGTPLADGKPTSIRVLANSQNDPRAQKELAIPAGATLCQETYATNPNQQIFDALNRALDAIRQGNTPAIELPQIPFLDTASVHGSCPQ